MRRPLAGGAGASAAGGAAGWRRAAGCRAGGGGQLPGWRRGGQQAGSEPAGRPSREQPGRRGRSDGDPVRRVHRLPGFTGCPGSSGPGSSAALVRRLRSLWPRDPQARGSWGRHHTGLATVDALDLRDREGRGPAGHLDRRQSIRPWSVQNARTPGDRPGDGGADRRPGRRGLPEHTAVGRGSCAGTGRGVPDAVMRAVWPARRVRRPWTSRADRERSFRGELRPHAHGLAAQGGGHLVSVRGGPWPG